MGRDGYPNVKTYPRAPRSSAPQRATIGQEFSLDRAADAHAAIEARSTTGKTLLRIADADERGVLAFAA